MRISKKTSKLRVTGLCAGNSPGTGEFPAQMVSNAENVSMTSSCIYLILLCTDGIDLDVVDSDVNQNNERWSKVSIPIGSQIH